MKQATITDIIMDTMISVKRLLKMYYTVKEILVLIIDMTLSIKQILKKRIGLKVNIYQIQDYIKVQILE